MRLQQAAMGVGDDTLLSCVRAAGHPGVPTGPQSLPGNRVIAWSCQRIDVEFQITGDPGAITVDAQDLETLKTDLILAKHRLDIGERVAKQAGEPRYRRIARLERRALTMATGIERRRH